MRFVSQRGALNSYGKHYAIVIRHGLVNRTVTQCVGGIGPVAYVLL